MNSFQTFAYVSNYLHLKSFAWSFAKSLSDVFKTTNVTNFTKAIPERSYRVLQVTFKQKTLKQRWKAVESCSTFWNWTWHNFGYISGKVAKPHFLERLQKSKQTVESAIFWFLPFHFFQISNDCCQKSYNGFRMFLESSAMLKIEYFWSAYFWKEIGGPFKFLWNFNRNAFCFLIFSK